MSKFLKFIVHLIVICTILCVVALAVPPFYGVTTEIRDDAMTVSNLPMGSVTYAVPTKTENIQVGDPLLVNDGESVYRYNLVSVDTATGTGTVIDPTIAQAQLVNVSIGSYVPKVVVTVGFIGYLMAATKSVTGLIILGLAVVFLIILYIIAELLRREPDDDDDLLEDTEPGYVKSKKELKREEQRRERQYREEERAIKAEGKRKKKDKRKIRTGGFVDEIDEDDFDDDEPVGPDSAVQSATSEAHEVLKKEIAAATREDVRPERPERTARKSSSRTAGNKTRKVTVDPSERPVKKKRPVRAQEEGKRPAAKAKAKKIAKPVYTPAQLASMSKKEGDNPDVSKDDVTKVTLFDYSDIFAEDEDNNSYDE